MQWGLLGSVAAAEKNWLFCRFFTAAATLPSGPLSIFRGLYGIWGVENDNQFTFG